MLPCTCRSQMAGPRISVNNGLAYRSDGIVISHDPSRTMIEFEA